MNNKNDSFKIVLIALVIVIAGYFVYKNFTNTDAGQAGSVISGTMGTISDPGILNQCNPPVGIYTSFVYNSQGNATSCSMIMVFSDCSAGGLGGSNTPCTTGSGALGCDYYGSCIGPQQTMLPNSGTSRISTTPIRGTTLK